MCDCFCSFLVCIFIYVANFTTFLRRTMSKFERTAHDIDMRWAKSKSDSLLIESALAIWKKNYRANAAIVVFGLWLIQLKFCFRWRFTVLNDRRIKCIGTQASERCSWSFPFGLVCQPNIRVDTLGWQLPGAFETLYTSSIK